MTQDLVQTQLRGLILRYLESYPDAGVMGLARKSRVSHMTIRRILSEELKGAPSPGTVLNLLSVLSKEKDMKKLITTHPGPLGDFLRKSYPHHEELRSGTTFKPEGEKLLHDREAFLAFLLCSTRSGSTREEIRHLLGVLGEEKLDQLIECEVLTEKPGQPIRTVDEHNYLSMDLAKKYAGSLIDFFKPALMHEGKNVFYAMVESVNEEGLKEIIRIQSDAVRRIRKVMNDENFRGELPVYSLNLSDTLSWPERKTEERK